MLTGQRIYLIQQKLFDYANIKYHRSFYTKIILILFLFFIYGAIYYLLNTPLLRLDFYSFYSAAILYKNHLLPYGKLIADYVSPPILLPMNLTPPFFLSVITPLTNLSPQAAIQCWYIMSLGAGLMGALLLIQIVFKPEYQKNNTVFLMAAFLCFYPTLINISIGQAGLFLFFFIIAGYYYYLKQKDTLAGLLWGIIIAVKLFPGLLFFFVLSEKRYKTFITMLITTMLAFARPLITHDLSIYHAYYHLISRVRWYGDNWNASFYGFLFRWVNRENLATSTLIGLKSIYGVFFIAALLWYISEIKKISQKNALCKNTLNFRNKQERFHVLIMGSETMGSEQLFSHLSFSLTLAMMLFMSPLGWLYYCPLLLMPFALTFQYIQTIKISFFYSMLWIVSFFMINFPAAYIEAKPGLSTVFLFSIGSLPFYGLLILIYLLHSIRLINVQNLKNNPHHNSLVHPSIAILIMGICLPVSQLINQIAHQLTNF